MAQFQNEPTARDTTTYNISISCDTPDAEIRYELSGSADTAPPDPTESSTLYTASFGLAVSGAGVQIKAKAFKSGMEASDVATKTLRPVTVPMALPDGSVLFYDRGDSYGEYCIGTDGYPVRLDGAEDDGSAESQNWRYLICDQADPDNTEKKWGPYTSEGLTGTAIGVGLPNTEAMLAKYADNDTYWWKLIKEKRDNTGLDWFMPSRDELGMLYDNKDVITSNGGVALKSSYYWSSSEYSNNRAWLQGFSTGTQNNNYKGTTYYCRLLRRI